MDIKVMAAQFLGGMFQSINCVIKKSMIVFFVVVSLGTSSKSLVAMDARSAATLGAGAAAAAPVILEGVAATAPVLVPAAGATVAVISAVGAYQAMHGNPATAPQPAISSSGLPQNRATGVTSIQGSNVIELNAHPSGYDNS